MTPILGIMASQISGHLIEPAVFQGNYWGLNSTTLATSTSSVTFSGIPQNYTHLQIRVMTQDTRNTPVNRLSIRVGNGAVDTGSNYSYHYLSADGATPATSGGGSDTKIPAGYSNSASTLASTYGVGIWDILDYADTTKNKTIRILSGCDLNGSGELAIAGGAFLSTAAIDTIQFYSNNAGNLSQYSSFALYGVK